jgi:hypothetical protein
VSLEKIHVGMIKRWRAAPHTRDFIEQEQASATVDKALETFRIELLAIRAILKVAAVIAKSQTEISRQMCCWVYRSIQQEEPKRYSRM